MRHFFFLIWDLICKFLQFSFWWKNNTLCPKLFTQNICFGKNEADFITIRMIYNTYAYNHLRQSRYITIILYMSRYSAFLPNSVIIEKKSETVACPLRDHRFNLKVGVGVVMESKLFFTLLRNQVFSGIKCFQNNCLINVRDRRFFSINFTDRNLFFKSLNMGIITE